ncbi:putative serine/threonine-protein kinase TAO1-A [Schistosoma mansoni]|uniref:putative serine/threonine-protein kinase TAO1-A n=1 Tax=Schistosoma mansoni TaxID=6183 RepID=UPI00022DC76C|nr:putative serine/threonine-protein kinase TAO1-A [Schistosoma mansoni]|eukprot:XP_018651113.1 putative serine/threonine-protein kinase TAO1-A [Schistosoma mansoni]
MPAYSDYKSYVTNNLLGNDHDIHYKMSKKIAQLTKVVCMLNSRGEDSVDLLKETSKQHEDEIMKLKSSYELKLRNLELRLEEEKRFGDTIAFLEKSINEKELEIISMESKCNQLINEHHLKEDMLKVKHNEEIIKMQQTIVEHKERYEKELNTIQGFAEQWKSHQCPNVEPILNEKSQLECELKRLQEKYSSLETEVEFQRSGSGCLRCLSKTVFIGSYELIRQNYAFDLKTQKHIYDQSIIKNNQEKNELSNFIKHNTEIHLNNIWQGRLNQEREEFQIELSKLHKLNEEMKYNLENHIESSKLKYDKVSIDRNMKYLQLKKEYDECLEKLKIAEAQLESKNENQLDKQNLILNSKYEDVQLKLKESRKLIKALENKSQLLRKQLSAEKSNFIHLKENFTNKLQEKESAIRNITVVKQNEIERLQQVNKELKSKLAKQSQEYENEIIEKKCNLEQVINKLTKEFEECQLTNKQIELKLMNECKKKENLEKQLIKLTNEMERMKNDYENLSKQAKEKNFGKNLDQSVQTDEELPQGQVAQPLFIKMKGLPNDEP